MNSIFRNTRIATVLAIMAVLLTMVSLATAQQQQTALVPEGAAGPANAPDANKTPTFQERNPRYRIGPGDAFDVQFEFSPEFDQSVTVQPDGFVTLKGIGDLHVAGQSVPELTSTLKIAYGKFLAEPAITVVLKDFQKPYFIAQGQVNRPGKYDLRSDTTVVEGLAMAGGLNTAAKHSQVVLFRKVSQEWVEAKLLDVKKMLSSRNLAEDLHLQPGDMIFVPQNRMSKIDRFLPRASANVATQTNNF